MKTAKTIDDYLKRFPADTKALLKKLRQVIRAAAPEAEEKIAYGIPTFTLNGNLVHFAGYKGHIGFYPASAGITKFKKELSKYPTSRGTVQLPLDKPIPVTLITRIVKFRRKQNLAKKKR